MFLLYCFHFCFSSLFLRMFSLLSKVSHIKTFLRGSSSTYHTEINLLTFHTPLSINVRDILFFSVVSVTRFVLCPGMFYCPLFLIILFGQGLWSKYLKGVDVISLCYTPNKENNSNNKIPLKLYYFAYMLFLTFYITS